MDITIFGRTVEVNVDELNLAGLKAIYDVLFIQWSEASSMLNYKEADKIQIKIDSITRRYQKMK